MLFCSCENDYVVLVDGQTANDPVLGKYCGSSQPPTVKSTGNVMLIRFKTDDDAATKGFQATYQIGRFPDPKFTKVSLCLS